MKRDYCKKYLVHTVFEEKLDQGRKNMSATVEDIQDFERIILKRHLGLSDNRRVEVALVIGYPKYKFRRTVPRRSMEIIWNPAPNKEI